MTCGALGETGRDSWACRLAGRSPVPIRTIKFLRARRVNGLSTKPRGSSLQISTHRCPATNKSQPRFQRKHGGGLKPQLEGRGYPIMMSADGNTTTRGTKKNGKSETPAKKASKRSRKPAQKETAPKETAQQEPVQQVALEAAQPEQPIAVAMET